MEEPFDRLRRARLNRVDYRKLIGAADGEGTVKTHQSCGRRIRTCRVGLDAQTARVRLHVGDAHGVERRLIHLLPDIVIAFVALALPPDGNGVVMPSLRLSRIS